MHARAHFSNLEMALIELEYAYADLLQGKTFMSEASEFSGLEVPLSKLMGANREVQLTMAILGSRYFESSSTTFNRLSTPPQA